MSCMKFYRKNDTMRFTFHHLKNLVTTAQAATIMLMPNIKIRITSAVLSIAILITFGTWAFRLFEDWSWAESFYFTVSTLTTVGYGDSVYPTTDSSRVFTAIFILVGVGIVFTALTAIGTEYLKTQENRINKRSTRKSRTNNKVKR
jgi:hypothetical protein